MSDTPDRPDADNSERIAFWSGAQGEKWVRLQRRISTTFEPFTRALLDAFPVPRGAHVLDIGCGTGDTSLALADAVGPGGSVTGIDVSRPMLQKAIARAASIPELNLSFIEADAQHHILPANRFDLLFSRFGVMFFGDPVAAFSNLLGSAKPGGRFGCIAWRKPGDNPWATVATRVAKAHVDLPPRPPDNAPGQFGFADETHVRGLLAAAGWTDIAFAPFDARLAVGRDPADAANFLIEMGPGAQPLAEADEAVRARAHADLRAALEPHAGPGGVSMEFGAWIVTGRRP